MPLRGSKLRLLLMITLGLVGGCAEKPKHNFTFDTGTAAAASAEAEAQASAMRDATQCNREVARLSKDAEQENHAWDLLRSCLAQRKFSDLKLLLAQPFFTRLQLLGRYESARFLAKVLALRGTDLRPDLKLIERAGISISPLESACDQPELHKTRLVAFRGLLLREGISNTHVKFAEIDKKSAQFRKGPANPQHLSGRKVIGAVEAPLRQRLRPEIEYLGIGFLEGASSTFEKGESVQEARIDLVDAVEPLYSDLPP